MARQPQRWIVGLAPLAIIWIAATAYETGPVEADLTARGAAALGPKILDEPGIAVSGRDVSIAGSAFAENGEQTARDAVGAVRGVRLVNIDSVNSIVVAKHYVWSATRVGTKITLAGMTPDPDARAATIAAATLAPDALVSDAMTYARGDTASLAASSVFALNQLALVSRGSAQFSDGALTLSGEAPDSASYEKIAAALGKLPSGVKMAKADIAAPIALPFVWSAMRDGDRLTLSGAAPDPAARAAIVAAAKAIPGAEVKDAMSYARGESTALAAGSAFALSQLALLSKGSATISDGALTISGEALDAASYERALAAIDNAPIGVKLAGVDIAAPIAKPFIFNASALDGVVKLAGHAPSVAARSAIEARAKALFPDSAIDNGLTIAGGAPAGDFGAAANFALAQLAELKAGSSVLTDNNLSLAGVAKAPGGWEALAKAGATMPAGFTMSSADVTPAAAQPFVFAATKNADAIHLTGSVPSSAERSAIESAAAATAPGRAVINETTLASGLPPGIDFTAATNFLFGELKGLTSGEASLKDSSVSVVGSAPDAEPGAAIAVPAGLTLALLKIDPPEPSKPAKAPQPATAPAPLAAAESAPTIPDIATCQNSLSAQLNGEHIEFDSSQATIVKTSEPLLNALAAVASRCTTGHIEIDGHTDSHGSDDFNLALSKARAEAVVAYLVKAGVDSGRLSAVGFGASRPIAPNDTEVGRALNRRIEILVKE